LESNDSLILCTDGFWRNNDLYIPVQRWGWWVGYCRVEKNAGFRLISTIYSALVPVVQKHLLPGFSGAGTLLSFVIRKSKGTIHDAVITRELTGVKKHLIVLADCPPGIYFMKIAADLEVETFKLMVTR
jgi:hypothetical protein